jgi:NTE family protein
MVTPDRKADAVFVGGGVKGIALVGALRAFEEAGFQWQNVAGTSAGAITAALVAVGYSAEELKKVMDDRVDFSKLMDTAGIGKLPVVGPWLSLLVTRGMYKGDYLLALMRDLIAEKTGKERVTFADLIVPKEPGDSEEDYQKKYRYILQVVASDISRNEMLVLPHDITSLGRDPDRLEVALAVRMTMSIPFFFKPVIVAERTNPGNKHWIVDGGMLSNFPIDLFDSPPDQTPAWPTFGFLLWEPGSEKPRQERIRGLISMTRAMVNTMSTAHDRKALKEADASRIVKIPTGKYTTTDFDLSAEDRDWLYNSGYQAAHEFLYGPKPWKFEDYVAQRLQQPAQPG